MSKKQGIRYREVIAAPGSNLYAALIDSKESPSPEGRKLAAKKAAGIYEKAYGEFLKYCPNLQQGPA